MFNIHQLSAATESAVEISPQNATANIDSTGVDMQGWDGVMFILNLGVMGNNANVSAYAAESANSNFSGAVNINYPNAVVASLNIPNANANTISVLDLFRPDKRYVRLHFAAATANGDFVGATSVRYRGTGVLPVTHGAFQTIFVQVS